MAKIAVPTPPEQAYSLPETVMIPIRADVGIEEDEIKITFFTPFHAFTMRMPKDDGLGLANYIIANATGISVVSASDLPIAS